MFQQYEMWNVPSLSPPPSEALNLLHRLASDPGISGIMKKHGYTVGQLSEMPPEGKVGVSPVCILGVNINAGQEISLRLRTDDLQVCIPDIELIPAKKISRAVAPCSGKYGGLIIDALQLVLANTFTLRTTHHKRPWNCVFQATISH